MHINTSLTPNPTVAKFFDLSPADEEEVKKLKVTLYSNLAACYIKLENWDQVIRYSGDAIALDENNTKCYFRRSNAWEAKREWEKVGVCLSHHMLHPVYISNYVCIP